MVTGNTGNNYFRSLKCMIYRNTLIKNYEIKIDLKKHNTILEQQILVRKLHTILKSPINKLSRLHEWNSFNVPLSIRFDKQILRTVFFKITLFVIVNLDFILYFLKNYILLVKYVSYSYK